MSVVILYRSRIMSIMATDTRITWTSPDSGSYTDNNDKLINIPIPPYGWSAGCGSSQLIDTFQEMIINNQEENNTLHDLFNKAIQKNIPTERIDQMIQTTIALSWLKVPEFIIGMFSSRFGIDKYFLPDVNCIKIIFPGEYNQQMADEYYKNNELEISNDRDFNYILKRIVEIHKFFSSTCETVSPVCDIGIQIAMDDGVYKLRIKEHEDILLEHISYNTIESHIQVIEKISYT